jgi:hypothetical protein
MINRQEDAYDNTWIILILVPLIPEGLICIAHTKLPMRRYTS